MPEMKTLTINDIEYDLIDDSKVPASNKSDAIIVAGTNNTAWYRLVVTTAGNLRIDISTDSGATWETHSYMAKTMSGSGTAAMPVVTSSGRDGLVTIRNGESYKDGAGLWVYGNDHTNAGRFRLQAYNEATSTALQLDGAPDGSLKWNGREIGKTETVSVETVVQSNYNIPYVRAYHRAGVVDVYFNITVTTTSDSWVTIAKLPSAYCPPNNVYEDTPYYKASSNYENLRLRIMTTGEIQLSQGTASAAYAFHDTFICA